MRVQVAILTALAQEREAVCEALKKRSGEPQLYRGDCGRIYEIYTQAIAGTIPAETDSIRIAVCEAMGAGPVNAAIGTAQMLVDLSPILTMLVGIAGCMASDANMKLGDVAVGEDIYDYALCKEQGDQRLPDWKTFTSDAQLLHAIRQWVGGSRWARLVRTRRPDGLHDLPIAKIGHILSGNMVLASAARKAQLIKECPSRRLIAIEMEAGGVKAVLDQNPEHVSFLLVKGLSDRAIEEDKGDSNVNKDNWHPYACAVAAICAVEMICSCIGPRLRHFRQLPDRFPPFKSKVLAALDCFVDSYQQAPRFLKGMAKAVFLSAIDEVHDLANAVNPQNAEVDREPIEFRARIGHGHQFLMRAHQFFGDAKRITAFSVDNVSKFWMSPQMKDVRSYIRGQAGGRASINRVIRVFVFSTPEKAHMYARRLDFHAERHPNTFVCSKVHYEMFLKKTMAQDPRSETFWLHRDFALFDYENADRHDLRYFAYLNDEDLAIRAITQDCVNGIRIANVRNLCQDMVKNCAIAGEIGIVEGVPILRWRPELWQDRKSWACLLGRMFEQRTADVYHVTGFTVGDGPGYKDFRRALAQMKIDLTKDDKGTKSLAVRHKIRGVGLTKRIVYGDARPRDNISGGRLYYTSNGLPEDVIVMRVADKADLHGFLSDAEHTKLRVSLFLGLAKSNPNLESILKSNNIKCSADLRELGSKAEAVYEALENAAGLWRVDLQDDELIEELVETDPELFR
jgi:nucleoside phosphorylase